MTPRYMPVAAVAAILIPTASALAQTPKPPVTCALADAPARYGEINAEIGATVSADVEAGGALSPRLCASDCNGFVSAEPDLLIANTAEAPLRIAGRADTDTTLVVRDALGTYSCNDDGPVNANPEVNVSGNAGPYAVWLGVFGTPGIAPASITVTAIDPATLPEEASCDGDTLDLAAGVSTTVCAGGPLALNALGEDCVGYGTIAPTAQVTASEAGSLELIGLSREADLVIAARTADGALACNDDVFGVSPMVAVSVAAGEIVDVWVGHLDQGSQDRSALFTSRLR